MAALKPPGLLRRIPSPQEDVLGWVLNSGLAPCIWTGWPLSGELSHNSVDSLRLSLVGIYGGLTVLS